MRLPERGRILKQPNMEIKIKIPKKITKHIVKKYGTVKEFVKEFILKPLIIQYENEKKEQMNLKIESESKKELQEIAKGIIINGEPMKPKKNKIFG